MSTWQERAEGQENLIKFFDLLIKWNKSADEDISTDPAIPEVKDSSADTVAPKDSAHSEDAEDSDDPDKEARQAKLRQLSAFKPDGTPDYGARMNAYMKIRAAYIDKYDAEPQPDYSKEETPPPPKPKPSDYVPLSIREGRSPAPPDWYNRFRPEIQQFMHPNIPVGGGGEEHFPLSMNGYMNGHIQTEQDKARQAEYEALFGTPEEERRRHEKCAEGYWKLRNENEADPELREFRKSYRGGNYLELKRKMYEKLGWPWPKEKGWLMWETLHQQALWRQEQEEIDAAKKAATEAEKAETEEEKGKTKTVKGKGKK